MRNMKEISCLFFNIPIAIERNKSLKTREIYKYLKIETVRQN